MALTQISTDGIKNGTITGSDLATNVDLVDNQKIRFGAGNDLHIFHNGTNSVIADVGQGNLSLQTNGTDINFWNSDGGEYIARFVRNNAVELYHNGTKKFETTSTGARVTGDLDLNGRLNAEEGSPPATGPNHFISDDGSSTTIGTAATLRVANNGGNAAYSVFEAESGSGSVRLANDGQFYVTGNAKFSNRVRTDISSSVDGFMGEAYSGYFGLKHTDQTLNSEYMILSQDSHTFISASTGSSVYIRAGGNSNTNEMIVSTSGTTIGGNLVLTTANEGSGNGLDADTLDGIQGASFLRSNTSDTMTGDLTLQGYSPDLNFVSTTNNPDWKITNFEGTLILYDITNSANKFLFRTNEFQSEVVIDAKAGVDVTGNITVTGTVDGRDVASDGTKLDGIEASATADQTASEILTLLKTVDGAGSGLDADTLDGISSASFLRSDANDSASGQLTFSNKVIIDHNNDPMLEIKPVNSGPWAISINRDDLSSSKVFAHDPNSQGVGWVFEHCPYILIDSNYRKVAITSTNNIIGYSPNFPAGSAENIKDAVSGTPDNGWYWIQQFGNVARLHYCVFKDKNGSDIAGGPWTMNWVAGVFPNQFSTNGSTALGQYLNLCKGIGIDKPGRGMESSRTTSQVYGAWLAVKRALWDLDPGFFNDASSGSGGVLIMPLMNINGEGGSSAHRLVYSTGTSTHIPPNQDGDHCNANQLFCGWWGGNDFSSWATDNNSVPSPEDWGPGDSAHTGNIGAKSNSTQQKPSWKDLMLVTCIYK